MINIGKMSGKETYMLYEFYADSISDLLELKNYECAPGSSCLVIATSDVYIKNSKGEWVAI